MIASLLRILGPEHEGRLHGYLAWVVAYGVLQGLATAFMVPAFRALLDGELSTALGWLGAVAVGVVLTSVAQYVQAMRGFGVAIVVLRTLHECESS